MNEPECPQPFPYVLDVEPGKYAFCTCGRSTTQPYCDGSHRGTGWAPQVVEITEPRRVAWCGCKRSQQVAFCDGSHKNLDRS